MRLKNCVGERVRNTSENKPLLHLLVVEKRLKGLVDGTLLQQSSAGGTSTGAARDGYGDALNLGSVGDGNVIWDVDDLIARGSEESDFERRHTGEARGIGRGREGELQAGRWGGNGGEGGDGG